MAKITRPEDIVVEYLRANLTDPRTRYTADTDTFTATAGQTAFVLTPTTSSNLVRAIRTVTVDGTTMKKWQEYTIDLKNKTITLLTGATLADVVVITYYASNTGEEWIYPGFPIASMSKTKFPRISLQVINKSGARRGNYSVGIVHDVHFQLDVWTKETYSKTISSISYTEQNLADYLAEQAEYQFISDIDDLYPELYDYVELAFGQMPFDETSQTYRHKQEFMLSGVNIGH